MELPGQLHLARQKRVAMLEKLRALIEQAEAIEMALCDLPSSKRRDYCDARAEELTAMLQVMLAEAEQAAIEKVSKP